jgi:segregation and condensation protein A
MDAPSAPGAGVSSSPSIPPESAGQAEESLAYQIKLENFEGPLDLLLHLIQSQQVNIYDIPISLITRQYLHYLDLMKELNINVAGEFLVMAATLIQIKSRTLLPALPDEMDGLEDEQGEDPREELVRRLIEYQRYKEAAAVLDQRSSEWRDMFRRPADPQVPDDGGVLLEEMQLFDLVDALQRVIERLPKDVPFVITTDQLSVKDRMAAILDELVLASRIDFFQLCMKERTRAWVIVTFLAVLELVRLQLLMTQSRGDGELLLCRVEATGERQQWSWSEEVNE